jgi:uncharacterized protein (DUF1015 family)
MAEIHPFRGYRYNPSVVGDLNLVVTQPYDKIPDELQRDYYARSPFNVARITRSIEKADNPETDYSDAAATLQAWIRDGVLRQDPAPSIYAYEQEYDFDGEVRKQLGFVALLDVKHSAGGVLAHERTLAGPRNDRLRLMRATEANEDSIYTLYTDEKSVVNRALQEQTAGRAPDVDVRDDHGVAHRLWVVSAPSAHRIIRNAMVPEELFIADGHHRFETSMNFLKECEEKGWKRGGPESFDKRLVTCFNSADRSITILPTHRVVRDLSGFDPERFVRDAGRFFEVSSVPGEPELHREMKRNADTHCFGFCAAGLDGFRLLVLREEAKVDPLMLAHAEAYRHLDVSILHTLLLDHLLGINEAKLSAESHIDYYRERSKCLDRVRAGTAQCAFFLNPTSVEQVQRIALLGERMPQKSTDFYPKLVTGLVFMKMAIAKP